MNLETFTLTGEQLRAMVLEHLSSILTPDVVKSLAHSEIRQRIGILTPKEAAEKLQCCTPKKCREFCRANNIPVIHGTQKKWWVSVRAIEDWIAKNVVIAGPGTGTTRIARAA